MNNYKNDFPLVVDHKSYTIELQRLNIIESFLSNQNI